VLCKRLWPYLSLDIVLDNMWAIHRGILLALGMQFRMGVVITCTLWLVGVPLMHHYAFAEKAGLVGLWQLMPVVYVLMNVKMVSMYHIHMYIYIYIRSYYIYKSLHL
jgi:hypothetical protein